MSTAKHISNEIQTKSSPEKKKILERFFKTGEGEYGYGDIFLGVTVPVLRKIAKENRDIVLEEILKLLVSPIHEERLIALYFLIDRYKKSDENGKKEIYELYLAHTKYINNWDLVDTSCEHIVGDFLKDKSKEPLFILASSENLWEKRIAIVATFFFIKQKEHKITFEIADILLLDKHDLIHKACGWMLREVGKRCGEDILLSYLEKNSSKMARTTLRYAIERLAKEKRGYFLAKDKISLDSVKYYGK